jgi:hypothetical protein
LLAKDSQLKSQALPTCEARVLALEGETAQRGPTLSIDFITGRAEEF